jgi:hypothetical protein
MSPYDSSLAYLSITDTLTDPLAHLIVQLAE